MPSNMSIRRLGSGNEQAEGSVTDAGWDTGSPDWRRGEHVKGPVEDGPSPPDWRRSEPSKGPVPNGPSPPDWRRIENTKGPVADGPSPPDW